MKIFIAFHEEFYSGREWICGVFSSMEKALEALNKEPTLAQHVEEYTLDEIQRA